MWSAYEDEGFFQVPYLGRKRGGMCWINDSATYIPWPLKALGILFWPITRNVLVWASIDRTN